MRIAFFCHHIPDPCGAFFHDVILARALQSRGHSVIFVTTGVKHPRKGVYRGIQFMHYEVAGVELARTDLWSTPHNPILAFVRKLNEQFEKPLVVNMHYGEDTQHIEHCVRNGSWAEFLWFVSEHVKNNVMNTKKISPVFVDIRVFKPAFIEQELALYSPPSRPQGDCITIVNANMLKGLFVFVELAKHFPDRKFLGVRPYYNQIQTPQLPNIEWIDIQDDIRTVLSRTRVLLVPSVYESWGRIAFEAMYNGIPVLYTKPIDQAGYSSGSTEGMQAWIQDNGFPCERSSPDDWISNLQKLDDPAIYEEYSDRAFKCTRELGVFQEIVDAETAFIDYATKYTKAPKSKGEEAPRVANRVNAMSVGQQPGSRMAFGLRGGRFGMRR